MDVTQISIGRFHHFSLARQLEKHGLLKEIWTGYPKFKLKDESGIPWHKIKSFPWLQAPYMTIGKLGLDQWGWFKKNLAWYAQESLDKHVASQIKTPNILIALSSGGLHAGTIAQKLGGKYICDRGSSHIRFQDEILKEEYSRWGYKFAGIDTRIIQKEEAEYEKCDAIIVPSEFVKNTFVNLGIPKEKIFKVSYGARLERFEKVDEPDKNAFKVLWVGGVSFRKGFMDALKAFQLLKHPKKEFLVIGSVEPEFKLLLSKQNLDNVKFAGQIANAQLAKHYSTANVFVLASLEEGLAMVQGEALACGCPVIATNHTGCEDLFTDGVEGFIVNIRSAESICEKMQLLADDKNLRSRLSEAAIKKVNSLGGWDTYGNSIIKVLKNLECQSVR